jgi:hypothetical protein
MGLFFRKSFKAGPFRLTASKRGLGTSVGVGRVRVGRTGKRSRMSVRLPGGFSWRRRL